jgi:hypothetical protein
VGTGIVFWSSQPPGGTSFNPTVNTAIVLTALAAPLAVGAVTAASALLTRDRSGQWRRRVAGEVTWGVLLTGPAVFIVAVVTTTRTAISSSAILPFIRSQALLQGATSGPAWAAANDLAGAAVLLTVLFVLSAVAFLVIHALFDLDPQDASVPSVTSPRYL